MNANVAILGCGRSGTSIFGELFEAFPGYRYWSEPHLAEVRPRRGETVAVKVPRTPPGSTPPAGSSVSLDDLLTTIPSPRQIFWQVRHPLDAICSLRVGISDSWGHHPRPPDWRDWTGRPLLERCAHHWATINGPGYELVRTIAVVNRFEEMIADPLATAIRTARIVGVDPTAAAAQIAEWADRVQDTNNDRFVEALTSRRLSRPDHSKRVGRWSENLSPAEVSSIVDIVAPAATAFGYDLPT